MKFLKSLGILILSVILVTSCEKEYSEEGGGTSIAVGTLKAGVTGECLPSRVNGIFKAGTVLASGNYLDVTLNFTTTGTYFVKSDTVNGYFFRGVGIVSAAGITTIRLGGIGTPLSAGTNTFTVKYGASTCTILVDVLPTGAGAAVYTLGGSPNNCTGVVLGGTYQAGLATGATNTAKLNVTVNTVGTYSITTTAVNGVAFSGSGSFAATGAQTVTLTATGTPVAAGPFNHPATVSGSNCSFSVTYATAGAAALYTLAGAGSNCSPGTVAGTYTAGTALTTSNTVTIQANVTTVGTYTLSTTAVNGMTFSATGVFAATGPQTVVLVGTGTPTAASTNLFNIGTAGCSFNITVGGTATDFITAKVDGVLTTFNVGTDALIDNSLGFPALGITGDQNATMTSPVITLAVAKAVGGPISANTYTVNQSAAGILVAGIYMDATGTEFSEETDVTGTTRTPGFTIVISTITATRVTGTFFGTLKQGGVGPAVRTITEGAFSLPLP